MFNEIFDYDFYKKIVNEDDEERYLIRCFPLNSYVTMKDTQKKYKYYTIEELKVIGYNDGVLLVDILFDNGENRLHPDNVEISKRWLRKKKIEFLGI